MSQKAIKKKTIDTIKSSMKIPVQPLSTKNAKATDRPAAKSLPQKSFPLNKFIALPEGLRPKSNQTSNDDLKSPKRSTPIKAVVIPSGTSSSDSRAHVYVVDKPRGSRGDQSSEACITLVDSVDYDHHSNTSLSSNQQSVNGSVTHKAKTGPFATSTPRSLRRGFQSAQTSPRRDSNGSQHGSINSADSYGSSVSTSSRKRRYKKRSQSAPPDNSRRRLQDTDFILQTQLDNDQRYGINRHIEIESDGISIQSENWTCANIGITPTGAIRTVYRSNSLSSPSHSVDNNRTQLNGSSHSELEFTDVCKVNSTYHDNSLVDTCNGSVLGQGFARNDTYIDDLTGVYSQNSSLNSDSRSHAVYTHSSDQGVKKNGNTKFVRSWSDLNLDNFKMEARNRTMSSNSSSMSYAVNGVPQSGIVIRRPGGDNIIINDRHNNSAQQVPPQGLYGHDFYTVGRKQGTLMQSKLKFSSMPTLHEGKGDKKLMKLLKKQEKEERKRREKEERKRAKEEKKRLKMESKLKTKTLPRNFAYTNGHVMSPALENMYRRPKLSLTAVPIDIEGDNFSMKSVTPAPKMAPPPLPGPSFKTMSLYSSAPDLLRLEQVYGATLRGVKPDQRTRPKLTRYE